MQDYTEGSHRAALSMQLKRGCLGLPVQYTLKLQVPVGRRIPVRLSGTTSCNAFKADSTRILDLRFSERTAVRRVGSLVSKVFRTSSNFGSPACSTSVLTRNHAELNRK